MTDVTESTPATETDVPPKAPANRRLKLTLAVLALLVLATVAWGGHRIWKQRQISAFAEGCRNARQSRSWDELTAIATKWTKSDADAALPWIYLAQAAQETNDFEAAADFLNQVPDDDPMSIPALLERTTLLFGRLNRPLEGIETCDRILRIDPSVGEARQRAIFFYAMSLQRAEMLHHLDLALEYGCDTPENYVYLMGRDWLVFTNAAEHNHHWLTTYPDNEDFLVARALTLVRTGVAKLDKDEEGAPDENAPFHEKVVHHEKIMKDYLERFPQNVELLLYFMKRHATNGDTDEVAKLLAQAPASATEDNRFWQMKGWWHNAKGQLIDAEQAYRKALELNPFDWLAQHELADVLRRLRRPEDVKWYEDLANEGNSIRRFVLQLPDARSVPRDCSERMARYASKCGDQRFADHLSKRIGNQ